MASAYVGLRPNKKLRPNSTATEMGRFASTRMSALMSERAMDLTRSHFKNVAEVPLADYTINKSPYRRKRKNGRRNGARFDVYCRRRVVHASGRVKTAQMRLSLLVAPR